MGSSLALATRWAERAGSGGLLVTLSDLPGADARHLRGLADLWRRTGAPAVATGFPEGPGSPAVLGRELFAWLRDLGGDVGARELLRRLDEVPCLPLAGARDVDTREDAAALGCAAAP
jgi:CTP:molybdopterin cytidylyltransferase MocA